jgi:ATP sulfurylase
MTRTELESVLTDCRLPSGVVWPLPILLQVPRDAARDAAPGRTVALRRPSDGRVGALLHVRDCFAPSWEDIAHRWFGTASRKHPGVARLLAGGEIVLGGPIELVDAQALYDGDGSFLTPEQTRLIFSVKGWKNVVAFHSTGIPDLRQEWLMKEAVARTDADGLFIHPMTGGKSRDAAHDVLLGAYDILVDEAFPGALFGPFPTYPRHGGAREQVFLALCRKNFGCTHFVVGTDDSELGEHSGSETTQTLLDSLGDIGIEPVLFDPVLLCHDCAGLVERCGHAARRKEAFDGKKIDQALSSGQPVPEWAVRPSIARFVAQNRAAATGMMVPPP